MYPTIDKSEDVSIYSKRIESENDEEPDGCDFSEAVRIYSLLSSIGERHAAQLGYYSSRLWYEKMLRGVTLGVYTRLTRL